MKPGFKSAIFLTTLLLGAVACLGGCATTGSDRATKTTTSMQTVEVDYKNASKQIDVTNGSLEELIKPSQSDIKKAYNVYSDNVSKMEKLGAQVDTHTDQMRTRGNEYFAEWDSTYSSPEIRELSERRRIEIRESYAKIPEATIGVKGALKSYMEDIRDIQKYLSNDLTPQGVENIKPTALKAINDGDNLRKAIRPVLSAIDQVKVEMSQGGKNKPAEDK